MVKVRTNGEYRSISASIQDHAKIEATFGKIAFGSGINFENLSSVTAVPLTAEKGYPTESNWNSPSYTYFASVVEFDKYSDSCHGLSWYNRDGICHPMLQWTAKFMPIGCKYGCCHCICSATFTVDTTFLNRPPIPVNQHPVELIFVLLSSKNCTCWLCPGLMYFEANP